MTNEQKEQIKKLRFAGKNYGSIASELNMPLSTIKVFCYRNSLRDADIIASTNMPPKDVCPYCGNRITQIAKQKPRRFCSDKCRLDWWKAHPECKNKKAYYKLVCNRCGKEYMSYGNQRRKYCCQSCYTAARLDAARKANDRSTAAG